jgi:hypothetical protein
VVAVAVAVVVVVAVAVAVAVAVVVAVAVGVEKCTYKLLKQERKMSIDDMKLGDILNLAKAFTTRGGGEDVWKTGEKYFIRTVTHYHTGRLVAVTPTELVLEDAAWVADTGRFSDALKTGVLKEVEPFPGQVIVGRGAVVDACIWKHDLPQEQK